MASEISDEMIEAAARAIHAKDGQMHMDDERMFQPVAWEELDDPEYPVEREHYRARALAAIRKTHAVVGWQGMSTAPKDGTRILLWQSSIQKTQIGEWDEDMNQWSDGNGSRFKNCIRWMPLPNFAATQEDSDG